jgi:hypothetical protein
MSDHAFRSRSTDPMREVDLILLEDALMRRSLETSRTAVGVQTACMTILALFLFGLFLYSVTHRESVVASASVRSPTAHSNLPMP